MYVFTEESKSQDSVGIAMVQWHASQHGAIDSVANLSNSADVQNVSCLELFGRDICSKSYASYDLDTSNP